MSQKNIKEIIAQKKRITLQPKEREDGVLPYPYFLDERG